MTRYLLFIFAFLFGGISDAQVKIRLFYGEQSDAIVIRIDSGKYTVMADGKSRGSLGVDDMVFVSMGDRAVKVSFVNRPGFLAESLQLLAVEDDALFSVKRVDVDKKYREFGGNISVINDLGTLLLVNSVDSEKYIAAVVQAEGGSTAHPEYFKTQAIIARTYLYMHRDKHGDEGYDLCDNVHCQAYLGSCNRAVIIDAVNATAGLVITDADSNLIIAPFHSNCGGETVAAEEVWLSGRPYLVPVIDPYCSSSRNAGWEKRIPAKEWVDYLREHGYNGDEASARLPFNQVTARTKYYTSADFRIPFTTIRNDLKLRSSFFSISPDRDLILFSGKGYGHGVGLCQEGAMVMARRGFTFDSIIGFYFNNVKIMNVWEAKKTEQEIESF